MMILMVLASTVFLASAAILAVIVVGIHAEERHATLTRGPDWRSAPPPFRAIPGRRRRCRWR
jgi:hypothetical protein